MIYVGRTTEWRTSTASEHSTLPNCNPTLKECLEVIETLAAASQLGIEEDEDDNEYTE
jgi:hypothetical protein